MSRAALLTRALSLFPLSVASFALLPSILTTARAVYSNLANNNPKQQTNERTNNSDSLDSFMAFFTTSAPGARVAVSDAALYRWAAPPVDEALAVVTTYRRPPSMPGRQAARLLSAGCAPGAPADMLLVDVAIAAAPPPGPPAAAAPGRQRAWSSGYDLAMANVTRECGRAAGEECSARGLTLEACLRALTEEHLRAVHGGGSMGGGAGGGARGAAARGFTPAAAAGAAVGAAGGALLVAGAAALIARAVARRRLRLRRAAASKRSGSSGSGGGAGSSSSAAKEAKAAAAAVAPAAGEAQPQRVTVACDAAGDGSSGSARSSGSSNVADGAAAAPAADAARMGDDAV